MKKNFFLMFFVGIILFISLTSGAHYIVGIVNDAKDGTSANNRDIFLWNPVNGLDDNLSDIIGINGNSGTDNMYMIDCELLNTPCSVNDEVRVQVFDNGDGYLTGYQNLSVSGAGFDLMENLTLNSPPNISSVYVDDSLSLPVDEIDLLAANTREVICEAIVNEPDSEPIQNYQAKFFDKTNSFYSDSDDNNTHYTNDTCYLNSSYGGADDYQIFCSFQVQYYANPGEWECLFSVEDNNSLSKNKSDNTTINSLLSIGAVSFIDFGTINSSSVSEEVLINVTNYGNVMVNLSLSGYANSEGDGFAMNCSSGGDISIEHEKYNVSSSNSGSLDLESADMVYRNLTSTPVINRFNLDSRKNDVINDAINNTYWRMYLPLGVSGDCQGHIIFGASISGAG